MLNFFGVQVKPAGVYTHVSGVSFNAFSNDIGRYYSTSLIEKYQILRESWDAFKVHNFFLVELDFIIKDLLEVKTLRSRRRELKELQHLLWTETWLKDTKTPTGQPFDFSRLKVFNTPLLSEQREFLETYPLLTNSYHLKGLLLDAKPGTGKAMPLTTLVKVPGGWKKLGDLKIGDTVIGPKGNIAMVTDIHPQGVTDCYRFTFEDGRTADSHPLHLWEVTETGIGKDPSHKTPYVTTTQDIVNNFTHFEYYLPLVSEIDGYSPTSPTDPDKWATQLLLSDFAINEGVLELAYNERFSIVRAMLMQSGCHIAEGIASLLSGNENAVKNFQQLVWSIGGICSYEPLGDLFKARVIHRGSEELLGDITSEDINKMLDVKTFDDLKLKIVSIQKQTPIETLCISIDSEDSLYIVDNWIVTHNTFTSIAWARLINDAPTIVIHPLSTTNEVWMKQLRLHYKVAPKIWTSTGTAALGPGYDYYLVHYDVLQGPRYEQLKRSLQQMIQKSGEQFKLILDESHNFNEISAKQTQHLIELNDLRLFSDTLPMSGTPLKALGSEVFTVMCLIDKFFDLKARQFFLGSYGRNRPQLMEMLNHRIGRSKFTIPEIQGMGKPAPFEIVKVKVPNGGQYTLEAIRLQMQMYITERVGFYNAHMKEFKQFYDETVNDYAGTLGKQPALIQELAQYKIIVARFRSQGYDNFKDSADSRFCKAVEEKIEARLKGKTLSDFRSVKSAVKYLGLKIRGEALGNVLGKARMNAIRDLIEHAELPKYIDNVEKKTVIFTSYVEALKQTSDYLTGLGYQMVSVYGETNHERDSLINKFADDPQVNPLGATYDSLKEGVPLLMANQILSLNAPWRVHERDQVQARIWRRGQDAPCFFTMFDLDTGDKTNITTRSIDILEWSREQVDALLDKTAGHEILGRVTGQEMLDVSEEPSTERVTIKRNSLSAFV